nr:hypothetical protein [Aromatoleum aromaticum]
MDHALPLNRGRKRKVSAGQIGWTRERSAFAAVSHIRRRDDQPEQGLSTPAISRCTSSRDITEDKRASRFVRVTSSSHGKGAPAPPGKLNRRQTLPLCRRPHVALSRERGLKSLPFLLSHVLWMAPTVMNDVSFDPVDIRLPSTQAVVLQPQPISKRSSSRTETRNAFIDVICQHAVWI